MLPYGRLTHGTLPRAQARAGWRLRGRRHTRDTPRTRGAQVRDRKWGSRSSGQALIIAEELRQIEDDRVGYLMFGEHVP
ncbi:hypothetical protein GCM10023087_36160 [Microbacterium rhizosphaerae]